MPVDSRLVVRFMSFTLTQLMESSYVFLDSTFYCDKVPVRLPLAQDPQTKNLKCQSGQYNEARST